MPVDQDHLEAIQAAVAAALAQQQQQQAPPAVPQADLAAAAAAAVAAAAPQVAAVDINAISQTIPSFWPEDVRGGVREQEDYPGRYQVQQAFDAGGENQDGWPPSGAGHAQRRLSTVEGQV